jgi:hypothetical protein
MPTAVWSHNTIVCKATNFIPFQLMYNSLPHRSLRTIAETIACPNEAEEKDLLESDRLKAFVNLEKYHEEIKAWRDPKVKL